MKFRQFNCLAICSIVFSIAATSAFADTASSENPKNDSAFAAVAGKSAVSGKRKGRTVRAEPTAAYASNTRKKRTVRVRPTTAYASNKRKGRTGRLQPTTAHASGFGSSSVVAEARRYIGTNPTNRRSLWCGAFMSMVLQRTGHKPGSNLARAYASYGKRVSGPQVGALAVMTRGKRGGHVGVVSGIDQSGNVIVVSGNHNNTVAESVYPRTRIFAYVMPGA